MSWVINLDAGESITRTFSAVVDNTSPPANGTLLSTVVNTSANTGAGVTAEAMVGVDVFNGPVDLTGTVKTADGADVCAMMLASGKFMFSCNSIGVLLLEGLPREGDGTVKRQIYADGFFPKIDVLKQSTDEAVVLTRSGTCPSYNGTANPGLFPGAAGDRINMSGKVLQQASSTPICAMVLANGQFMFSCGGVGSYALNIPLDGNGQFKLQVYADGFAPNIQVFDMTQASNDVRMARAVECQSP